MDERSSGTSFSGREDLNTVPNIAISQYLQLGMHYKGNIKHTHSANESTAPPFGPWCPIDVVNKLPIAKTVGQALSSKL